MLGGMKTLATLAGLALSVLSLAGCPEKKPEGDGAAAATKPATSTVSPAAPAAAPAAPAKGGW